jgi:hypothetical protein
MGLQTEKSSKDFAKNIDIIMHNINEYVNYFTKKSTSISLAGIKKEGDRRKIKKLKDFTRDSLIDMLGDDDRIMEMSMAIIRRNSMFSMFSMGGSAGMGGFDDIGSFYGEDKKDTSKALSYFLSSFSYDATSHDFTEMDDKRLYIIYPNQITVVRMEPSDILGTSLSEAAYAILRGRENGEMYVGMVNAMTYGDHAGDMASAIMRSKIENPEIILIMNKNKKKFAKDVEEHLGWNGLKCKFIFTSSDHLAIAADLDGYLIFDRESDRFHRITLWDKVEEKKAVADPKMYSKFSEILIPKPESVHIGDQNGVVEAINSLKALSMAN